MKSKKLGNVPSELEAKSVDKWLDAMKNHTCSSKSLKSDDDPRNLRLNYTCSCGNKFSIGLIPS